MSRRDAGNPLPLTPLWYNILLALADKPRHGYAIMKEIESISAGAISPATGTVYLALQRLSEDELIAETPAASDKRDGRRRRSYRLTRSGREIMVLETRRLVQQLGAAVLKKVIDPSVLGIH